MNEKAFKQVQQELTHAGEDSGQIHLLKALEECRITTTKEIPPMEFLFQMFGKPCFPRGELVAISGKAKSGKTFVSSILMTLCFKEEVLSIKRLGDKPLNVLWFDTEQSEESTQDILKNRILPMIRDDNPLQSTAHETQEDISEEHLLERFQIFNVRGKFWQERLPLLEAAMHLYKPDLVILDGIRDLVSDINDGVMAQEVIERLMHLASEINCCLVSILHQNKSAEDKNLRGWIGTELKNKAFEAYECTKDADRIFTWSQTDTRKYDILDKLKYTVDDNGIPILCSVEQIIDAQSKNSGLQTKPELLSRPLFNPQYVKGYKGKEVVIDVIKLFSDAFRPGEQKTALALQECVMKMANITSYSFYNKRRQEALAAGVIQEITDPDKKLGYLCPIKPKIPDTIPREPDLFSGPPDDVPF